MDPPTLRISLLGGFELRHGPNAVVVRSGRVRSLLAWLALHARGAQPRTRAASALWPDTSDGQARTNLRNLLHQLRRVFPEIDLYLDTDGPDLGWRPLAPVHVDVAAFERAIDEAAGPRAIEDALALYAGPLLPDDYDEWLAAERDRLARLHAAGMDTLMEHRLTHGEHARALDLAARILDRDPLHERAHRARILACAALGDRAGAQHAWQECRDILERELGVEPDGATRTAWLGAMRSDASDANSEAVTVTTAPRPRTREDAPAEARFVGRAHELERLAAAWRRTCASSSAMVWISGEPGIGKTRLAHAFADRLRAEGASTVEARAYPTLGTLAYGPVIAWLRTPALAKSIESAAPSIRRELRRLLPELEAGSEEPHADDDLTESERRQRLHDAVIPVLSAARTPRVLILDDIQWSDQESIDLVSSLVLRQREPVLVLATLRTGETDAEQPLMRMGVRLRAAGLLEEMRLEPLDLDETGALVRDLADRAATDDDVQALHRETEGNPLFIVETMRSGRRWASADAGREPAGPATPRIRAVIEARLNLLAKESLLVTRVAATIGREFTLPLLLAVSPLDEDATLRGIDDAWRRMLVRERDDGSWDFSHGRIREVAFQTSSPIRRREWHRRIAEVLERSLQGAGPSFAAGPDQIALHYDHGDVPERAVDWYRRAAKAAAAVSGLDAIRRLLGRALELVMRLPTGRARDEMELDMRLAYGAALVALDGYARPHAVANYERSRELCALVGRPVLPPVVRALAIAALARGDLDAGIAYGLEMADAAERDDDPVVRVESAYVLGVLAFWKGGLDESERLLSSAIDAYRPDRHREHVTLYAQDPKVVCLSRLAWTLWHRGRVVEAYAFREEALQLARHQGDPLGLAYAEWFAMFIAIDEGDVTRMRSHIESLQHSATTHRLVYIEAVMDVFAGYFETVGGHAGRGIERMRATLADPRWFGMEYVLKGQALVLIARAAAAAGDVRAARATVAEAMDYLGPGPSIWKAPLLGIDARMIGVEDRTGDRALPAFEAALARCREYGSAWSEMGVAIDRARWTLENSGPAGAALADLERALVPYAVAPPLTAMTSARVLIERLGG